MVERRRINETRFSGFSPNGVNPDRVKIIEAGRDAWEETRIRSTLVDVEHAPSWALTLPGAKQLRLFGTAALASLALFTAVGNLSVEKRTPARAGHQVEHALNARDFLVRVNDEFNRVVSVDFINRFATTDEHGNRVFNPGAIVFPLSVGVTSEQNFNVNVQLNIPYDWARTFREVQQTDPARAHALKAELVAQLREQIRNQVIIHGLPGLTNSTAVWNAHGANLAIGQDGNIVPPEGGRLNVEQARITGNASDEATDASSLGARDPQNEMLAENRGRDLEPVILDAMKAAGFDVDSISNVTFRETENYLTADEISGLADITYRQSRFARDGGTAEEAAMSTIYAYNHGESLDLTPADTALLHRVLNEQRRVDVAVTATGREKTMRSFNVGIFLPLALLLIGLKRNAGGVRTERVPYEERVSVIEIDRAAVARRLFMETIPETLNQERDFNTVYNSVSLSGERPGHYEDLQRMQQHMLIEEVLPSLRAGTREPFIDYVTIANNALEFMYSDSPKYGIRKGHYPTTAEAQRFIAEELIKMWEHHDQAVYPMSESPLGPIDIKTVLNYRHSEHVVTWAKLLAEQLVGTNKYLYEAIGNPSNGVTRDEFEKALRRRIAANAEAAGEYRDRNVFVVSDQPEAGDYRARVNTY